MERKPGVIEEAGTEIRSEIRLDRHRETGAVLLLRATPPPPQHLLQSTSQKLISQTVAFRPGAFCQDTAAMAPIEPDVYNSNIRPLSILGGYFVLAIALTSLISYDVLYKAFGALPPSQDTRHRKSNREKYIQLFALLALVSLATAWYHMLQYFGLSYRVSAYEMGEVLPLAIWGDNGYLAYGEVRLALGRWLKDTSLFRDAWEIVIERSRRYWWSQQIFLGSAAWAVFVGIEGEYLITKPRDSANTSQRTPS